MIHRQRQTKNTPQITTSNIYIVPAFPPLDNVNTTLLGERPCQYGFLLCNSKQTQSGGWRASSHQGELPRTSQDHSIACYTEEVELATQLLLLADAHHAALVPLIAQLLQSVAGSDIGQFADIRLLKDELILGSIHSLAKRFFFWRPEKKGSELRCRVQLLSVIEAKRVKKVKSQSWANEGLNDVLLEHSVYIDPAAMVRSKHFPLQRYASLAVALVPPSQMSGRINEIVISVPIRLGC